MERQCRIQRNDKLINSLNHIKILRSNSGDFFLPSLYTSERMLRSTNTKAIIVTILMILLGFYFAAFFTDHPVACQKKNKSDVAAIAIRDNVIYLQKYGTRLFSLPYMKKYYSEVRYFTENYPDEHYDSFVVQLKELLSLHDSVDIYLLAHSNTYYSWVNEIDSVQLKKIRLVYNTGCSGALQKDEWKRLGVKYYVAHESNQSISPVFYFYFLRRYTNGQGLSEAIKNSNEAMHEKLFRLNLFSLGSISVDEELEYGSEGKLVIEN